VGYDFTVRRWLFVALLAGCGDNNPPAVGREVVALPGTTTNQLDVLFVLADEVSTADLQTNLSVALPALLAPTSIDETPDLHLGVITPDLGTSAKNGSPAPAIPGAVGGCADNGDDGAFFMGRYATSIDDVRPLFHVGSNGCGYQQDLAAIRAAFTNPANAGFRRPGAALGVIVVADEEDCSALDPSLFTRDTSMLGALSHFRCTQFGVTCDEPDMTSYGPRTNCVPNASSTLLEDPADFVDVLHAQAADPRRVAFGAVIGPTTLAIEARATQESPTTIPAAAHSCRWHDSQGSEVDADPAIRVAWVADHMGDRGAIGSICNEDDTAAATTLGINLRRAMGDPCVEEDIPLLDCTAVDELGGVETPLPLCAGTQSNCFELVSDPLTCPNAAHQKLVVHHTAADGTYTLLRC
jgi:hypothetical protein